MKDPTGEEKMMAVLRSAVAAVFGSSVLGVGLKISYLALTEPLFFAFHNLADGVVVAVAGSVFLTIGLSRVYRWALKDKSRQARM